MNRVLAVILLMILVLAGCSAGSGESVNIIPAEAAQTILNGVTISNDTLIEAPDEVVKEWYNLDDKVSDFKVYVSGTQGTASEIAVIKSSDIKTAQAAVEKRIDDLKFRFESYVPAEMPKLNGPVIVAKGDVVIMVLSNDSAKAKEVVDELFKK